MANQYILNKNLISKAYSILQQLLHTLNNIYCGVNSLKNRNNVRSCFTSAIFSSCQNITASKCNRNAGFLDWWRLFPALLKNSHEQVTTKTVIFKLMSFCVQYILHKTINYLNKILNFAQYQSSVSRHSVGWHFTAIWHLKFLMRNKILCTILQSTCA